MVLRSLQACSCAVSRLVCDRVLDTQYLLLSAAFHALSYAHCPAVGEYTVPYSASSLQLNQPIASMFMNLQVLILFSLFIFLLFHITLVTSVYKQMHSKTVLEAACIVQSDLQLWYEVIAASCDSKNLSVTFGGFGCAAAITEPSLVIWCREQPLLMKG